MLEDTFYFENNIASNMKNNYYWSDNWSNDFYITLAKYGFISTSYDTVNGLVLLPELQYEYAILDFNDLHISTKVKKLLHNDNYELRMNTSLDEVLDKISAKYKDNWLKEEYIKLLKNLYNDYDEKNNFQVISVELFDINTNELVSGEVGYKIGKVYTSLSGFSSREKKYNNYGTLQLILFAKYLQKNDFEFWNFGHPHMEYKKRLGCKVYSRSEFLHRWNKAINN